MTTLGGEGADHTLASAHVESSGEGPMIYAVRNLKAYLKAGLEEELGAPVGPAADCGAEVVCACVPADTCACNTVSYHVDGASCPGDCPCQCETTSCMHSCDCYGNCYSDCGID